MAEHERRVRGLWAALDRHVAFEGNRPANVRHPLYSLADAFAMFEDMVLGRRPY